MKRKPYTESDYEFICKHYGYLTAPEIAKELNRTSKGIMSTLDRLRGNGKFDYYRNRNKDWKELVSTKNRRSGVRGITWNKDIEKWKVVIHRNKQHYYFGSYKKLEDACKAQEDAKKYLERKEQYERANESRNTYH